MIISRGERVETIPEEEIEAIRRIVAGQLDVEPHPFLRCGERVRVVRGSLEGVEGILTRKKEPVSIGSLCGDAGSVSFGRN